ncbi:MAG: hypothetical protein JW820_07955 [Spirochaetales bacterium]|nr:hypothetical protein [Spirochaetales bacterium]
MVRIPLDVPEEIKQQFLEKLKSIDHTMGLNTALRFIMIDAIVHDPHFLSFTLNRGKRFEAALAAGLSVQEIKARFIENPKSEFIEQRQKVLDQLPEEMVKMKREIDARIRKLETELRERRGDTPSDNQ